ncbi:MAG TPA: hypothetical protein PKH07_04445 [bacterium]|nr:hypothetical protein [bacterium]
MKTLRILGLLILGFVVVGQVFAGTVELQDGKQRQGQVIVRENVVTINTSDNKTFQFYLNQVKKITATEEKKHLIATDVTLKSEANDDAAAGQTLSKGMEVEELEQKDGWLKVKAVRENEVGWVKPTNLVKELVFEGVAPEVAEAATESASPKQPSVAAEQPKDATPSE